VRVSSLAARGALPAAALTLAVPGGLRAIARTLALILAVTVWISRPAAAAPDEPFLRGPHPFHKENALTVAGGYGVGRGFHGVQASVDYGYELAGSLWFDLRLDLLDAGGDLPATSPPCPSCAQVDSFVDLMAGLRYKLQTDIPLVPYGSAVLGPVFLFHRGASGGVGLALRASLGARYFLYDWLGLGLELGLTLGGAIVEEATGLNSGLRLVDLGLGAEVQF
jgi:hypothetical protein